MEPKHNPYQAPSADLQGFENRQLAPALWNPNAAANWCLMFSPIFGAWLHMKNWQALEQYDKARKAQTWLILSAIVMAVVVFGGLFVPLIDVLGRLAILVLLISWYFAAAKEQMRYVQANFGASYPRKGWAKPLGLAILAVFGLIFVSVMIALAMQ